MDILDFLKSNLNTIISVTTSKRIEYDGYQANWRRNGIRKKIILAYIT